MEKKNPKSAVFEVCSIQHVTDHCYEGVKKIELLLWR